MSQIGIIGGTGLETLPEDWKMTSSSVSTPFGEAKVREAARGRQNIAFVSRHGEAHDLLPHQVNYRANISALGQLGVKRVFATNAVGSLRLDLAPGSLVLLDDFIDFTHSRPLSYWEGHPEAPAGVTHTDFTEPYCPTLRSALVQAAADLDLPLLPRATYVCANGPRFESPAEIRMFAQWGGDVIGMTGLPEAIFAREAGICYAAVGIVTNYGAGLTPVKVDHTNVLSQMARQAAQVRELLLAAAPSAADAVCARCG